MKLIWYDIEVHVPVPDHVVVYRGERWHVDVLLRRWGRERREWPHRWRERDFLAPVFRSWAFGPLHVRRFTPEAELGIRQR